MKIELSENETLCVIVRHPKHSNNVISEEEAGRVRCQGCRLLKMGLKPEQIASVIASVRLRSQSTAELLLEGLGISLPIVISSAFDALDEIGSAVKDFKSAAVAQGMKPWEALSEQHGAELCKEFGIADRLVRATQFLSVCVTAAQLAGSGKVVVVSGHNGNGIEVSIELAKTQSLGERISSTDDLPNPVRYVVEAGIVLAFVNTETGLLSRDPVYLDAN